MSIQPAKILKQSSHLVPGKLKITEHLFEVPLNHASAAAGTVRLFARSATKHTVPAAPPSTPPPSPPWLLYLQGGPGMECRSPQNYPFTNTFLDRGYQIIFLDQRGTGLSSPLSASTILQRAGDEPSNQAAYLKLFRADSIVRDCEAVRLALTEQQRAEEEEKRAVGKDEDWRKWSVLGQSFGGFCCVTYLSFFPKGLREVFIAGGLPPVEKTQGPDDVYKRLVNRVMKRNKAYYDKFPEDVQRVHSIVRYLQEGNIVTPSGGRLTARRFLENGLILGFHGCIEALHELVLKVALEIEEGVLTRKTLSSLDSAGPFDNNPIYAFLHEPIYCQGIAPKWSAKRIIQEHSEFSINEDLMEDAPIYFTGEMVFPEDFDDYDELSKIRGVAMQLAEDSDWPDLYNVEQLNQNEVPTYAAVYMDDMYVDFDLSSETASKIKGIKTLVTNRIYHDGIRSKEEEVLRNGLFSMRDDVID
ncbi:hypothetical protein FH972_022685 [Carpinus fangiana]|uniref:AB hydrolase-1 domain-containing protein n=1 Tax=Carpinus fangiana TaxID=176857 RepID=A0A5N6KTI2_9ROSI|nr:hypothetical protein FH972_022685 [Carpinus fangiana]